MIVHASAPCRLDFAGGWTDVEPFVGQRGGVVVNAAIDLRARVTVELGGSHHRIDSEDLATGLDLVRPEDFAPDGRLDLLKAALRYTAVAPCRLRTGSAVPPGSGLGSSGALDVALMAALDRVAGRSCQPTETAERAWRLETIEAGLPAGKQDQYAAALGGFHRFAFEPGGVEARPLELDSEFLAWLERQTVLCYTGQSRVSGQTIDRVMNRFRAGDPAVARALAALVEVAGSMTDALLAGDVARVGQLLTDNWRHQQALDPSMQTPLMARVESVLHDHGALGGKAAGAGAGGSMFFVVRGDRRHAIAAVRALGISVLPFTWSSEGVRVW